MFRDELVYRFSKRICSDAQIIGSDSVLGLELMQSLHHGPVRRTVGNDSNFASFAHYLRRRNDCACRPELTVEPRHIVDVIVWTFAVLRLFVVSTAAGEICS